MDTPLTLGGKTFRSRLLVGTGKYPDYPTMVRALAASGAEIVTVAVRREELDRRKESLLDHVDPNRYFLLPNTAACYTVEDAVRTCFLAREAGMSNMVKLEGLGDEKNLFPDPAGLGIRNPFNIKIILETVKVPVIVDAGVGTASDAAVAMELGCDGVLMNTGIAGAKDPVLMAEAMREAVSAGRKAFLAGRIAKKLYATASSPLDGPVFLSLVSEIRWR